VSAAPIADSGESARDSAPSFDQKDGARDQKDGAYDQKDGACDPNDGAEATFIAVLASLFGREKTNGTAPAIASSFRYSARQ
jgi:hypothetical protein